MRKMAEYIDKQTVLDIIASFRTPYRKEVRVEDVYDAVRKAETVTINDTAEEIKVTNCNHNADDSKKASFSWPHENGLIDRKQAIEAYGDWYVEEGTEEGFIGTVKQLLEGLPPAQPEERTNERTETHACDCISRQAAIDETWKYPTYSDPLNVLTEVRDRIKALPSAQPERKKGKWVDCEDGYYLANCSECGFQMDVHENRGYFNFCPNCGADMRGGEGE